MHTDKLRVPRANRLAVVDLIAMVTLAIGVGLAAGIVLGGAVLLFSSGETNVISDAATLHVATLARL